MKNPLLVLFIIVSLVLAGCNQKQKVTSDPGPHSLGGKILADLEGSSDPDVLRGFFQSSASCEAFQPHSSLTSVSSGSIGRYYYEVSNGRELRNKLSQVSDPDFSMDDVAVWLLNDKHTVGSFFSVNYGGKKVVFKKASDGLYYHGTKRLLDGHHARAFVPASYNVKSGQVTMTLYFGQHGYKKLKLRKDSDGWYRR